MVWLLEGAIWDDNGVWNDSSKWKDYMETDIFDRSNVTFQTAASRSSDHYDAGNPYVYHISEIADPRIYNKLGEEFFELAHRDKVIGKIERDGDDIIRYYEQMNYANKKVGGDLTKVTDYSNVTDIYNI